jgi:hypothetical protein
MALTNGLMEPLVLAYMEKRQEMWALIADKIDFREWKLLEEKVRGFPAD